MCFNRAKIVLILRVFALNGALVDKDCQKIGLQYLSGKFENLAVLMHQK